MKEPIKPNEVSLYNHGAIAKDGKPLISNADYAILMQRVQNGDSDAYYVAISNYTLEPKQEKILTDIIHNRII